MNPACDVAPDELIAFTEEDLPERRMRELEAHVPSCPACQERLTGARETTSLLQQTMPAPSAHSRHDLLVRLYQEAEHQTDRPHRGWTQAASLTAVGGIFLLAAVLLWSGVSQFIDAIPQPFQQASQDQGLEWVAGDDESAEQFESAPLPDNIGAGYPLHDWLVRSNIRVIVYQEGDSAPSTIEVRQYREDDPEPPGYMDQISTVQGVAVYTDDPDDIREIRWTENGMAHHVQMYLLEPGAEDGLSINDVEEIVQTFLDD